jgi:hypothetical protein
MRGHGRARGAVSARAVFAATLVAACTRPDPAPSTPAVTSLPAPSATSAPSAFAAPTASAAASATQAPESFAAPTAAAPESEPAVIEGWLLSPPVAGKAVGNTSVAFKVHLANGNDALFKPRSARHGVRYRGEIAAYRLARLLGLDAVPPAYLRTFDTALLRNALASDAGGSAALFAAEVRSDGGVVRGALMPWRTRFEVIPLEKPDERARWSRWLSGGQPMPEGPDARLAAQISTLVAFDLVTGNWDRWSGGNIVIDDGKLLFVDNDAAFADAPPAKWLADQRALLAKIDRFSRGFVSALERVDVGALRRAFGEESAGVPMVSERALAGVDARRREVVALVRGKAQRLGDDRVLAFD